MQDKTNNTTSANSIFASTSTNFKQTIFINSIGMEDVANLFRVNENEQWDLDNSYLQELLRQHPDKTQRGHEQWMAISQFMLLQKSDVLLWENAIERAFSGDKLQLEKGKEAMFSVLVNDFPTSFNVGKWLEYTTVQDLLLLISLFKKCELDYLNSQYAFNILVKRLEGVSNADEIFQLYKLRLLVPHKELQQTYEAFSQFISKHYPEKYTSIMRQESRSRLKVEKESWYIEQHEARIRESPQAVGSWINYIQSVAKYDKLSKRYPRFLPIFYRAVEEANDDESWHKLWQTALIASSYEDGPTGLAIDLSLLYRKVYPRSYKPLRELALLAPSIYNLAEVHKQLLVPESACQDRLEAIKALLIAKHLIQLHKNEDDMDDCGDVIGIDEEEYYLAQYPQDASLLRLFIFISRRSNKQGVEEAVTKAYNRAKFIARIFVEVLLYFVAERPGNIPDWLFSDFEANLESFDDPVKVLDILESFMFKQSEMPWRLRFARIGNLRDRVGIWISANSNKEVQEPSAADDKEQEPKSKRQKNFKEHQLMQSESHRNREQFTVTITGFDSGLTENDISEFLLGYAKPVSVVFANSPMPLAKVELLSEQEVLTCLTRDKKPLCGQTVSVERVFGSSVWITNYPPDITADGLAQMISNVTGHVLLAVRFPAQTNTRERRFCYVDFATPDIAEYVKSRLDGLDIQGYEIKAEISNPALRKQRPITSPKFQVHVKNLNFTRTSEASLRSCFSRFGEIDHISMPLKGNHRGSLNSGYAFITFKSESAAKEAIEAKNVDLDDRKVQIFALRPQEAHEREARFYDEQSSITILNVSSSVTSSQLTSFIETLVGPVKRLTIQANRGKALVEFKNVPDAGKADLLLTGSEFQGQILSLGGKEQFFESEKATKVPMMVSPMFMRRKR